MGSGDDTTGHIPATRGLADFALLDLDVQENRKRQLTEALQRKKNELKKNIQLISELSIQVKHIELRLSELRSADKSEEAMQTRRKNSDDFKEQLAGGRDMLNNLLDHLQDEVQRLSMRFSTAPDRYGIQKVSEDISILDNEAQEIKREITDECDLQIASSEAEIQKEPVIILEVPGSPPNELSAIDLDIMISKLKESTQKLQQKAEELMREKEELEKREASLSFVI